MITQLSKFVRAPALRHAHRSIARCNLSSVTNQVSKRGNKAWIVSSFGVLGAAGAALAISSDQDKTEVSCEAESPLKKKATFQGNARMPLGVYDIPLGKDFPDQMPCFIEVSKGSRNKYEWDNEIGLLRLDRVLHSAVFYPHNYGFVPQTKCEDGDALDVLVLGEACVPGSIVDIRPLGYMIMEDEKGLDEKVLAVPSHDPRFSEYQTLRDVPEHLLREIAHFFDTYKALEKKKWAKVGGWKGTEDTKLLIQKTHKSYLLQQKQAVLEAYNANVYDKVQSDAQENYNEKVYKMVRKESRAPMEKYNADVYDQVQKDAQENYNEKVYKMVRKESRAPMEKYNADVYDQVQKDAQENYNEKVYKMVRKESKAQ